MNLVIDIGNTQSKAAVFSGEKIVASEIFPGESGVSKLKAFIHNNEKINSAILSSVVNHSGAINKFLRTNFNFIELNEKTKLPIKNSYKTPQTLGKDRLANAVGANYLFPNQNVLCIDAGTCIKYDFINSKNEYLGGAISPGLDMRFKSLHHFTANLPLLEKKKLYIILTGQTTGDSIFSGVQNGTLAEISGIIKQYRDNFKNLIVIFTGGDSEFFNSFVSKKNHIFADSYLTLIGLNAILNYNNETK